MKKTLLLLPLCVVISTWSFAQSSPNALVIPNERTEEYCEIRIFSKSLFRSKVTAHIDFGNGDDILKDAKGREIDFASNVAVLNYMNSQGWKLIDVHNRIWDGDSYTFYIMKRTLK